jgi:LysM repeat protein
MKKTLGGVHIIAPKLPGQRRVVNLLMSLSAVLLVVSLVTGAGLLQNIDRVDGLERRIAELSTSHRNLLSEFTNAARPVFADNTEVTQVALREESAETPPVDMSERTLQEIPGAATSTINIEELISQLQEVAPTPAPQILRTPTPPPIATPTPTTDGAPDQTAQAPVGAALLQEIPEEYVVEIGDTLSYISRLFYGSIDRVPDIMRYNDISDSNSIRAGDTIKLPRR